MEREKRELRQLRNAVESFARQREKALRIILLFAFSASSKNVSRLIENAALHFFFVIVKITLLKNNDRFVVRCLPLILPLRLSFFNVTSANTAVSHGFAYI